MWKRQPSMRDFTNFQMNSLTSVAKAWYNFLCIKIKPTLHLSTVAKDKTILLYIMTQSFKSDIGSVIERGLIESTQGRCIEALIHPSLITQLCQLAEVPMLDFEEQVQQCLPIPLPKAKFGSSAESAEEADDDAATTAPSEGESEDGDPEVPSSSTQPLADQIHVLTTRFDHIGMRLRNTMLPLVRIWMHSRPRWPSFTPTRTKSRSNWLNSFLFTLRHRHRHRNDSQGGISVPLFPFLSLRTLSVFNWGVRVYGLA